MVAVWLSEQSENRLKLTEMWPQPNGSTQGSLTNFQTTAPAPDRAEEARALPPASALGVRRVRSAGEFTAIIHGTSQITPGYVLLDSADSGRRGHSPGPCMSANRAHARGF